MPALQLTQTQRIHRYIYVSCLTLCLTKLIFSGKTALLELAILRLFRNDNNFNANQKAIYIAPLKALVEGITLL